jgi:hypothetical protein
VFVLFALQFFANKDSHPRNEPKGMTFQPIKSALSRGNSKKLGTSGFYRVGFSDDCHAAAVLPKIDVANEAKFIKSPSMQHFSLHMWSIAFRAGV